MSRPRRVPEWPESLKLKPTERAEAFAGAPMPAIPGDAPPPPSALAEWREKEREARDAKEQPITAIALGTLRDGRHAALELTIQGREVMSAKVLLVASEVSTPAEVFREAAYLRLFVRRDFSAYEVPGRHPLDLEQLRDGSAIALPTWKGKPAALAFDFEGRTVTEPKVVATGDRAYAWGALETWAACNLLPRGRR